MSAAMPSSASQPTVAAATPADGLSTKEGGIQSTESSETPVLLKEAQAQLEALYEIHDFYFSALKGEKQAMLRAAADKVLATLDAFGQGGSARERARVALLRGRTLDAMDAFDPEAEAALTKAVKLEPSDVSAWNALAHCFWKKKDLAAARDCLLQGIGRRPNKESLRMLSMVLRQLPPTATTAAGSGQGQPQQGGEEQGAETKGKEGKKEETGAAAAPGGAGTEAPGGKRALTLVEESVQRAKEAVMLDLADPQSWYILGNAYVALFFSLSHAHADLERALGAYQKAEANGGAANPDLFFNLAQVRCYREEFALAAAALQRAADLDPGLPVPSLLQSMERRVARTVELLAKRGKLKEKRLQQLAAALVEEEAQAAARKAEREAKEKEKEKASSSKKGGKKDEAEGQAEGESQPAVARVTVGELSEGPNPGKLLALKLVLPVGQLDYPPISFIVLDKTGRCAVLSVYHMGAEAARRMDKADVTLHVLSPHLATMRGPVGNDEEGVYQAIQILDPLTLLVDGQPIHPTHIAPARVRMETFDA